MLELAELMSDEPAWPGIDAAIVAATNDVVALPANRRCGEQALLALQVTTRSALGAMALESGGLLIQRGWVRVLGGAGDDPAMSFRGWNAPDVSLGVEPITDAFLVAHDIVGGLFALNGGRFDGDIGSAWYFAPDTLGWTPLEVGYSTLLRWLLAGEVATFYDDLRWPGWEREAVQAAPNQGIHFYPPPFTREGRNLASARRTVVPITELHRFYRDATRPG